MNGQVAPFLTMLKSPCGFFSSFSDWCFGKGSHCTSVAFIPVCKLKQLDSGKSLKCNFSHWVIPSRPRKTNWYWDWQGASRAEYLAASLNNCLGMRTLFEPQLQQMYSSYNDAGLLTDVPLVSTHVPHVPNHDAHVPNGVATDVPRVPHNVAQKRATCSRSWATCTAHVPHKKTVT